MSTISEHIFSLYNQLKENESQHIDDSVVDEAVSVVKNTELTDSYSLFYILAAVNLLNAAIKVERYKSQLFYGFIKSRVSRLADACLDNPDFYEEVAIYYDNNQKCIYFDVYGVIFSFHQIQESNKIKNIAPNNKPITWAGIRLQRIAQSVYTYAKEVYDKFSNKDNLSGQKSLIGNMEPKSLLYAKSNLYPCPDCQHLISPSATICPNCGGIIAENTIIKGYCVGDIVQITHSIYKVLGEIASINPHFISIYRRNDAEVKIRINAIDSIQSIDKSNNTQTISFEEETNGVLSPQKIVNVLDDVVSKLFSILSIENKTVIPTNATVTGIDEGGIVVLSDNGETARLFTHMINYKKKNCPIGTRLYINNIAGYNCPFSIMETTFHNLMSVLRKAILYRKGLTSKRKNTILSILKFMMEEMTSQKEAYIEFDSFYKTIIQYIGTAPNLEDGDDITDNVDNEENAQDINTANSTSKTLYKTETERLLSTSGLTQPKVLGKIDIDTITGKNKKKSAISSSESSSLEKPSILLSDGTLHFLNKKLTNLSEPRCKALEKELDSLIRNGKKEECLKRSYEIISTSRPTPKYLKSYLDRIVNTEIALDHVSEAIRSLAFLIAVTEQQDGSNANSLGHLYLTMARLYLKEENKDEALKAILYAEKLRPDNNAIKKLKESIMNLGADENENKPGEINSFIDSLSRDIVDENISKMLLQDVEQEAHRQELLPSSEIVPAEQLFGKAQNNRNSLSDTYDDKAYSFLEAAAAYYNNKQTDTVMFKISIANYARFKGHGMFTRFSNHLKANSYSLNELQAFRDSACSYYIEALGIFNTLGEKNHLQELLLKYLQLHFVVSQLEGGKTPDPEWDSWTLKQLQQDCLNNDSTENFRTLLSAYITVGAAAEGAWGTLASDADGTGVFTGKCKTMEFRRKAFNLFNEIEHSTIENNSSVSFNSFVKQIFSHRKTRIKELQLFLDNCLSWGFSTFDISTFETKWSKVAEFEELMTSTDRIVMKSIKEVIEVLKPYAGILRENERTKFLVRSQQILLGAQKMVTETATFYGRTFFSHLISAWLKEIAQLLEERYVSTYPKLEITPDPCYIKENEDGYGVIDFLVTNIGDSTAQSFTVRASINGKEYTINHNDELSAGDCCVESFVSADFLNVESLDVNFSLTSRYEGKELPSTESEATYEVESGEVLTDEIQIPWKISDTPKENIFKGREENLSTLINHYLSKDRTQTYILYGLTRTGKSSILDYLCERIDGQPLREDSEKKIKTFKWDFSKISFKNASVADLWMNLLEINIYNKLPEDILDVVDGFFPNRKLPETLCQSDLDIMVGALNSCGFIPLITIDEFSNIKPMLKEGLVDATFISELRDLALKGKACFVYAGTYDIKELPKEKEFGIEGQMTNTLSMPINEIKQVYADELIDACESIVFVEKAKAYIRSLSGCVPYWIQWICLDCGKYAVAHKKRHLGYRDVDHVVKVLTGEEQPSKMDTWEAMDETNFHNNQISPKNIAEHQLISCISYLIRESTQIERGVSMDELTRLWDKYNVPSDKRLNMTRALKNLEEKRVVRQFTDETREVYRLNVDLFRRWWYMHHRDLALEFSL